MTDDPKEPDSIEKYLTPWDYQRQHNIVERQMRTIELLGRIIKEEGKRKQELVEKIKKEEGDSGIYQGESDPLKYLMANFTIDRKSLRYNPPPPEEKIVEKVVYKLNPRYRLIASAAAFAIALGGVALGRYSFPSKSDTLHPPAAEVYALKSEELNCDVTGKELKCTSVFKEKKMDLCRYSLNEQPFKEFQPNSSGECPFSTDLEERVNVIQFSSRNQQGWHFAARAYEYSKPAPPAPAPAPPPKPANTPPAKEATEPREKRKPNNPPTVTLNCDVRKRSESGMECLITPKDNDGYIAKVEYRYGVKGKWKTAISKPSTGSGNEVYLPIREGILQVQAIDDDGAESKPPASFTVEINSLVLGKTRNEYTVGEKVEILTPGLDCWTVTKSKEAPDIGWIKSANANANAKGVIETVQLPSEAICPPDQDTCTYEYNVYCSEAVSVSRVHKDTVRVPVKRK